MNVIAPRLTRYLDRALTGCLFLLALSAPVSIAATQTAWAFAVLFWLIRAIFVRPRIGKSDLGIAVLAFTGLTILSSLFSYEPQVSLRKLVSVSLVTIVYLVSTTIRDRTTGRKMIWVLLISGILSVMFTLGTLAVGKNLKVISLAADSPLRILGIQENDTIITVNGKHVNSPDEFVDATRSTDGAAKLIVYRYEFLLAFDLPVSTLTDSSDHISALGIQNWSRGRDTRAAGFFGHYTTYAEVLQLILSIAFGLLIAAPGSWFSRNRILLVVTVLMLGIGLFLTVTRASWAGFLISAGVMVLVGTTRKTIFICLACAIPVAIAGGFYLQQKRNVTFMDARDGSTTWRTTVWREGSNLLISNPRHLAVGIGMDSIKTHYMEWGLFDNGKLPVGHMHSTPLQLALERGIPALVGWLVWMFIYLKILLSGFRRQDIEWPERGLVLGALGGMIGFLASGLVHYNWGDSEVAMVFYLLMGLSLAAVRPKSDVSPPAPKLTD